MRLELTEIEGILAAAREAFGSEAEVRLFGSRVRDDLRGGDIDLHVLIDERPDWLAAEHAFQLGLFSRLGERKIDVVLACRRQPLRPIDRIALETGVSLT